jgi:hypothetical protein
MSAVVSQTMTPEELVAVVVGGAGKDIPRIVEILQRGTFVSSASRFRWERLEVTEHEIALIVALHPDPDPQRPFDPSKCEHAVISGAHAKILIEREPAERRRLFRRRSFWSSIIDLAAGAAYARYSYKDQADVYRATLNRASIEKLREGARLSPYSAFSKQIEAAPLDSIEFFVKR